ncbi:hypothetical protein L873DRAFT_1729815 [Choiromyces venosus 120613-1]|uniref:RRM domain-containing protein n=1 Tax=Choiromyces venosus 120613-1 TaxID=1336337 RepID=A0A3N4K1U7_9PEZI|nr:hypothetical protein L873DRAFT_1729815 [Choiromyces venosus 120613-1]
MPPPVQIPDYTTLPITLPPTALVEAATHYLYIRPHAPKQATPDDPRSLFVVNVPIDATSAHLRALFSSIGGGRVDRVIFESSGSGAAATGGKRKRDDDEEDGEEGEGKGEVVWDRKLRKSGSSAVVMFVDKASRDAAIRAAGKVSKKGKGKKVEEVVWGEGIGGGLNIPALGISRYLTNHNLTHPSKAHLQASVNTFMAAFEADEAARLHALAKRRQEPDEDGFVTVVRGGRVAPARQEEAKVVLEKKQAKDKHEGFYRFQVREERKSRQMELLKKFEEDKKRVAERKNLRRFKVSLGILCFVQLHGM